MTALAWYLCRRTLIRTVRDPHCTERTSQAMASLLPYVEFEMAVAILNDTAARLAVATEDEEKKGWRR